MLIGHLEEIFGNFNVITIKISILVDLASGVWFNATENTYRAESYNKRETGVSVYCATTQAHGVWHAFAEKPNHKQCQWDFMKIISI